MKISIALLFVVISIVSCKILAPHFFESEGEAAVRIPRLLEVSKQDMLEQLRQMTAEYELVSDPEIKAILYSAILVRMQHYSKYEPLPEDLKSFGALPSTEVTGL